MARSVATLVASMALDSASFVTDIDRAAKRSQAALRKFRKTAETASKAIGSAIGVGLGVAIHEAIKFEKAMAEVGTLLDDTSGLDATADAIKRLSVEFGQAPTDQAKALYQIISAGASDATTQVDLLTASNRLALGGVTDVATAADGLTTVLNAYAGSGLTASEVSDSLFTTMKQGKTTIEELSSSVGNVATIAAQTGVSLREVGAAVGTLTKSGIATGEAMNALRGVLAAVLKQSKQSTDTAADLGVAFSVSALQAQGLAGFLQQIADSGATEEQLAKLFGRVEGLSAVMAIGANDAAEFTAQLEAQAKAAGATEDAVAKMADTTAFKVAQARSAFQVLSIEVGETFLASISDAATGTVENIDKIRKFVVQLVGAFKILGAVASAVGALLVGIGVTIVASFRALITGVLTTLTGASQAAIAVLTGDIRAAATSLFEAGKKAGGAFAQAGDDISLAAGFIGESFGDIKRVADGVVDDLNEIERQINATGKSTFDLGDAFAAFQPRIDAARRVIENAAKALNETGKEALDVKKHIKSLKPELQKLSALWEEVEDALDSVIAEQGRFEQSVQSLIDAAFPVEALVRDFEASVKDLNRALQEGLITPPQYQAALNAMSDSLGRAAAQSQETADRIVTDADRMKEAALEGVRQITDAFLDMWSDILSGSESSFDGIQEAFSKMMASIIHQATTQKIQLQFEQAFGEGGGGFTDLNAKELGISFGALAAAQFSDDIVQGLFGDASTTDYVEIGQQIGTVVGAVIGSIIPVIGTALGAALGAIAGSIDGLIFGKLFGRKFFADIGGTEVGRAANPAADAQAFSTALGEIVGIKGRGGFGNFNDPETPGGQIKQAIEVFDQAIYDVLKSVGASDEIRTIISDLETWRIQTGNAATAVEDIIQSRFDVVLQGFSDEVKDFVSQTESVEEQIGRLSVALAGQKLFDEAPELFGDRTLGDFLAVVEAVDGGLGELGETLQSLAQQLLEIGGLTQFLSDFAASDLESDFNLLVEAQSRSVADALAAVNEKLFDAVANFDGSIESLQEIAGLTATVREGEIRYLQQLDSIQKGLNASLDQLEADIIGLTAEPKTASQVFTEAAGLIDLVRNTNSAEDIGAIQQEFTSLLRTLSPEDQIANQGFIFAIINSFRTAANERIEFLRANALANAQETRDIVGQFITDIGDPLDILIASNERIAAAVEEMAGIEPQQQMSSDPIQVATRRDVYGGGDIDDSPSQVFGSGLDRIELAIRDGNRESFQNDQALISAMINSLSNARFVVYSDPSLVNQ